MLNVQEKILELYLSGLYLVGLETFCAIPTPTPTDRMWAGQCLYGLDRPIEALEFLLLAYSQGLTDAAVLAASVFQLTGELERSEELLDELEQDKLSVFGIASFERTRGTLVATRGQHRLASDHFLRAWRLAASDPSGLGQHFLASFTTCVAFGLAQIGRDLEALSYLNRALETANLPQRAQILLVRALCQTFTGGFPKAHADFAELQDQSRTPSPLPTAQIAYFKGVLARAQGLESQAVELFLEAISTSHEPNLREIEVYSLIQVAAVSLAGDGIAVARAHLARARNLANGLQQHGHLGLQHGALLTRVNDPEALKVLETALKVFETLELERDIGIVRLHLAEAHLRFGQPTIALGYLNAAVDARHSLGCGVMLAVELRGLPWCFEFLAGLQPKSQLSVLLEDWRLLEHSAPGQVNLQTLGGYGLKLDGQDVRVNSGLSRTVQLLAYLFDQGPATLEQISAQVFSEVTNYQARKHIHVIRDQVAKSIPGLLIPYLTQSKRYVLKHPNLRLRWDVHEVRLALNAGGTMGLNRALALYSGDFLPQSDGNWAQETRSDLEFNLAHVALETLEDLYKLGEFQTCSDLAARLLEINPISVGISILLVKSVMALKGSLHARETLDQVHRTFHRELGEVPEDLKQLGQLSLTTLN